MKETTAINDARDHGIRIPVADKSRPKEEKPPTPTKPPRKKAPKPKLFTLREAYEFEQMKGHGLDIEKAIRAASFLLDYASNGGLNDLDKTSALGFTVILTGIADDMRRYLKKGENDL